MKNHNISDLDINRFVDGELSTKEADRISALASSDRELAQKIAQYQRINSSLHLEFDKVLNEAIPQSLLQSIVNSSVWNPYAIAATLLLGIFIGYFSNTLLSVDNQQPLAQVALSSHTVFIPEVRHPVEVGADEVDHLNAWLSNRLQAPVIAPDLDKFGISLVGGRLLHDAGKPAAQFMYENQAGGRFTLYIRNNKQSNKQNSSLYYEPLLGFGVTYWHQSDLSYALTGVENSDYLHELARQMQLNIDRKISF